MFINVKNKEIIFNEDMLRYISRMVKVFGTFTLTLDDMDGKYVNKGDCVDIEKITFKGSND